MTTTVEHLIDEELIEGAYSYDEYRTLIKDLLDRGKTTGPNQSDAYVNYTKLNDKRMDRLDKTVTLLDDVKEELQNLDQQWIWLVLTEAWCGDAAQNVPVMKAMSDQTDNIELKLILRDENPEIMNLFLTNGSKSIPKLICLDAETLEVLGSWGPRPEPAQQMVLDWKEQPEGDYQELAKQLQRWYNANSNETMEREFISLINEWH
jgi:hypothetical protein